MDHLDDTFRIGVRDACSVRRLERIIKDALVLDDTIMYQYKVSGTVWMTISLADLAVCRPARVAHRAPPRSNNRQFPKNMIEGIRRPVAAGLDDRIGL
jgi:hypothetical protein